MRVEIHETKDAMGMAAAEAGAQVIRDAIAARGEARIILATGASQFEMLDALTAAEDLDWSRVTAFHLDEYIGLPPTHPASFRKYLAERFCARLPVPLAAFHFVEGDREDPRKECDRLGALIRASVIDAAFVGIGENGHLAFNDPPADFTTDEPFLVVALDETCRKQQLGEGWFPDLDAVPEEAISMSIREILRARTVICTVPDERKARALAGALEGPVTPDLPSSVLRRHEDCRMFADQAAASLLNRPGTMYDLDETPFGETP